MSRILFLGDSHSQGYYVESVGQFTFPYFWQKNNYAEIYAEANNTPAVIYAAAGTVNSRYVDWVKVCLDRYSDIEKIVIQSLQWNRFLLASSMQKEYNELPVDFFSISVTTDGSVHRYTDRVGLEESINFSDILYYQHPAGSDYNSLKTILAAGNHYRPNLQKDDFIQVKIWAELMTHLQHQEYCKTMYIIDRLCQERNIEIYLWRMNDKIHLPEDYELYGTLSNTKMFRTSAEEYLQSIGYDLQNYLTIDQEHYNEDAHKLIANYFLPKVFEK